MFVREVLGGMSWTDAIMLGVLPVLAIASAFCSASETALFSLTASDRVRMRRTSSGAERAIDALLARPRRLLLSVLLLTNAANVSYFVVSSVLERRIESRVLSFVLNVASLVLLVLIADLLPKLLARSQRVRVARLLGRPLHFGVRIVAPVVDVLERWAVLPLVRLIRPAGGGTGLDADELAAVLELSSEAGEIDEDEQRLLGEVIEMGHARVRDAMTPRVAVEWIDANASVSRVSDAIASARRDWMPVFEGSMDSKPLGWLDVREYLRRVQSAHGNARRVEGALRVSIKASVFIPERTRLDRAFEVLRLERQSGAMVVDEFGAFVGVIGVSDVVRHLVAPVREAQLLAENKDGERAVVRTGEQTWSVSGRLPLRMLREFLGDAASTRAGVGGAGSSTIAGLVLQRLGRVPKPGDRVSLAGIDVVVRGMDGRRVERVDLLLAARGGAR